MGTVTTSAATEIAAARQLRSPIIGTTAYIFRNVAVVARAGLPVRMRPTIRTSGLPARMPLTTGGNRTHQSGRSSRRTTARATSAEPPTQRTDETASPRKAKGTNGNRVGGGAANV